MEKREIIQRLRSKLNRLGRDEFLIQTFALIIFHLRKLRKDVNDSKRRKRNSKAP